MGAEGGKRNTDGSVRRTVLFAANILQVPGATVPRGSFVRHVYALSRQSVKVDP
jgi:hypothetical protein